jgi:hypothetical protein
MLAAQSDNHADFSTEIAIHFAGPKSLDTPHVLVLPQALVCLDCGHSRFTIPEDQLRQLREGIAPSTAA